MFVSSWLALLLGCQILLVCGGQGCRVFSSWLLLWLACRFLHFHGCHCGLWSIWSVLLQFDILGQRRLVGIVLCFRCQSIQCLPSVQGGVWVLLLHILSLSGSLMGWILVGLVPLWLLRLVPQFGLIVHFLELWSLDSCGYWGLAIFRCRIVHLFFHCWGMLLCSMGRSADRQQFLYRGWDVWQVNNQLVTFVWQVLTHVWSPSGKASIMMQSNCK